MTRCSIDQVRAIHDGQNEDETLLQRSQPCHKGEFLHVSISARHTMWTESSWAFPESYNVDESWIVRSSDGGPRGEKGLITPPSR